MSQFEKASAAAFEEVQKIDIQQKRRNIVATENCAGEGLVPSAQVLIKPGQYVLKPTSIQYFRVQEPCPFRAGRPFGNTKGVRVQGFLFFSLWWAAADGQGKVLDIRKPWNVHQSHQKPTFNRFLSGPAGRFILHREHESDQEKKVINPLFLLWNKGKGNKSKIGL